MTDIEKDNQMMVEYYEQKAKDYPVKADYYLSIADRYKV